MTTHPQGMLPARRKFLKTAAGTGVAALSGLAGAQAFDFKPNQRYPDPSVFILDPSFAKYRIYSSTVEQLGTGMRWAEGPAYFPEGGYLLLSDIPNNRLMKYDEKTGQFSVHKTNVNYANGNVCDRQGRLISCEHSVTRRVTRTEKDGRTTVLADRFEGKRLNAPNDIVVKSDDSVWFTDPTFGIGGEWEGSRATARAGHDQRLPHSARRQAHGRDHRPGEPQRPGVLARREEALRGGVEGHAQPQHLGLRRVRPMAPASPTRPS